VTTPEALLGRCTFPAPGTRVVAAVSGGADSTALLALAVAHGLDVTAAHVDHGLRAGSADEADQVREVARRLGTRFASHRVAVEPGPNLEARARSARRSVLPPGTMTGHTADDQAETVVLRLLRGAGLDGMRAMRPGPTKPILGLRRSETHGLCAALGLPVVADPSNHDPVHLRNRVRGDVIPLLDDIAGRDTAALLARAASLLEDDAALLEELSTAVDPTDAAALTRAPLSLARRAVRRWLAVGGYPPDLATVSRVMAVAAGAARAAEVGGGRRVARSAGRLRLEAAAPAHADRSSRPSHL
jgi:tRNA(Ile)-lysidine synthase